MPNSSFSFTILACTPAPYRASSTAPGDLVRTAPTLSPNLNTVDTLTPSIFATSGCVWKVRREATISCGSSSGNKVISLFSAMEIVSTFPLIFLKINDGLLACPDVGYRDIGSVSDRVYPL